MSTLCATCETKVDYEAGSRAPEVCPHCGGLVQETRLGAYRLCGLIRRGGMATVYRAEHVELGTRAAVKILEARPDDTDIRERFAREARMAARVSHPGIVKIYDFGTAPEGLYLVMDLVEGPTLRELIDDDPIPVTRCLELVAALADVLEAAHAAGVVHRDIKPENVIVDRWAAVRVLDFGIARAQEESERLTRTGEILGTPEYMAPEQILEAPEAIGPHTDIYSLGVVLYELLTARSPFSGANIFQVLKYVEAIEPPPPSSLREGIAPALDALIGAAIAKDPASRPHSAAFLALALRDLARESTGELTAIPVSRRSSFRVGMVIGTVLFFLLGLWFARELVEPQSAKLQDKQMKQVSGGPITEEFDRVLAAISRLSLGDQVSALSDLDRAVAEGRRDAIGPRAVAWHLVNTLPAQLSDRLFWLAVPDEEMVNRYFEVDVPGLPAEDLHILASAAALAHGNYNSALESLQPIDPQGSNKLWASVLRILALYGDGRKLAARAEFRKQSASLETGVIGRMLDILTSESERKISLMPLLLSDLDRSWTDRYRFEAILAQATDDLPRLRAATELALVTGTDDRALVLHASARCVPEGNSPSDQRADRETRLRLSQRIDEITGNSVPGLEVTQLILALLDSDDAAVLSRLRKLPGLQHPCLQPFQVYRGAVESNSPFREVFRALLSLQLGWNQEVDISLEAALNKAQKDPNFAGFLSTAFVDCGPDHECVRTWLETRQPGTSVAAEANKILAAMPKTP